MMTPTGGFAWIIAEDWIDKKFIQRWEANTDSIAKRTLLRIAYLIPRALWRICYKAKAPGIARAGHCCVRLKRLASK